MGENQNKGGSIMCKATKVAEYIINTIPVDNLKLQKLLFYSQAVHLVLNNKKPLFEDKIEAWMYGPVVPNVYKKYKKFGYEILQPSQNQKTSLTDSEIKSVDMVIDYYGNMSGVQLVAKTHQESPWKDVYVANKKNILITNQSIYDYFVNQFEFDETEI